MTAIGETLRRERLRRNLDLQQVSNVLKLSTRFLEAIESEQFERLPGGVFTRSFVRQYARLLGLDEEEMAAEVARLVEPPAEAVPPEQKARPSVARFPLPPAISWDHVSDGIRSDWPGWLPGLALAVAVTLGCSGVYVWWERAQRPTAHAVQPAAAPPKLAQAAPPPPSPATAVVPPPEAAPGQSPAAAQPLEPVAASTGSSTPAASPASSAAAAPALTPASDSANTQRADPSTSDAAGADSGAPLRVQLTAREPVWVRAVSEGKTLFEATMAANESRTLDAKGAVELRLGNAGGIDIQVNGKPIGAVGPEGQIRVVHLTSGGFRIVAPSNPAAIGPL